MAAVGRAPRLRDRSRTFTDPAQRVRPAPARAARPPHRSPPAARARPSALLDGGARAHARAGRAARRRRSSRRQHSPLMSPIVWDLGHIANFEEQWVRRAHDPRARRDDDARRARPPLRRRRASRAPTRGRLPLLDRARAACGYLDEVRAPARSASLRAARFAAERSAARRRLRLRDARAARGAAHRDDPADDPARSTTSPTSRPPARAAARARSSSPTPTRRSCPPGPFIMGTDDRARRLRQRASGARGRPGALPHRRLRR